VSGSASVDAPSVRRQAQGDDGKGRFHLSPLKGLRGSPAGFTSSPEHHGLRMSGEESYNSAPILVKWSGAATRFDSLAR
jgi:hypothetical protein